MDPVLRLINQWLLDKCVAVGLASAAFVVKACADDIGASLAGLCLLEALFSPF